MQVHKIDYGQRVYQGTLDAIRQVIIATMLVIDSYNGETIGEPWISDRDEYVAGTTPSTGAQVAYTLAEPLEIPVTVSNLPIKSLSGYNHIESSTGEMEVEYITGEYQPLVDLIESSKHVYSTQEQIVGTWIDGSVLYEKTLSFTAPNITKDDSTSALVHGVSNIDVAWVETALYKSVNQGISRYQNIICATKFAPSDTEKDFSTWEVGDRSIYSLTTTYTSLAGREFVFTIRYTKSTPTRSLNLTKSAVTEEKDKIPDEIKNAPFEEKPDVNEADDDAPTEVER